MKGAELPVNTMIIVVIAVLVLIAVVAIFLGAWSPSSQSINLESVKSSACQRYVSLGYCNSNPPNDGALITINDNIKCHCTIATFERDFPIVKLGGTSTATATASSASLAECCYSGGNAHSICCGLS